jgi:gas vesicle protein
MSVISIINNYLEDIIKKINRIEDLPSSKELKNKIDEIDNKIKNMISQNKEFNEIGKYYNELRNMEEKLSLRKRIDAGVTTFFYFIYSITGSIIGLGFSIAIFFTTKGFVGHILILLSIVGSTISLLIGFTSLKKERNFTKEIVDDLKKRILEENKNEGI